MEQPIKIKSKELKKLQERILRTKDGKRYVLLSPKKRVKVSNKLSERELIVWLIKHLKPKRRKTAPGEKKTDKVIYPDTNTIDRSFSKSIQDFDAMNKLKNEVKEKELKVKELEAAKQAIPVVMATPVMHSQLPAATIASLPSSKSEQADDDVEIIVNGTRRWVPKSAYDEFLKREKQHAQKHASSAEELQREKANTSLQTKKRELTTIQNEIEKEANTLYNAQIVGFQQLKERAKGHYNGNPTKEQLITIMLADGLLKSKDHYKRELAAADKYKDRIGNVQTDIAKLESELAQLGSGVEVEDDSGLSEDQIDSIMKKFGKEYLGTIAANEIDTLKIPEKSRFGFVMNLDKRGKKGSHWISVFGDARPEGSNSIEYYDSFARSPSKDFMIKLKEVAQKMKAQTYLKFKENRIIDQDNSSANCGFFATRFLIDRFRGKPFSECTKYDDHVKQEKDIEAWKKKLNIQDFKYVDSFDGEGLVDVAKDLYGRAKGFFTGRTQPSPAIRKLVDSVGNEPIVSLTVGRSPVNSVITGILNVVSQGSLSENQKRLKYDQIYHLGLVVTVKGRSFTLERNETIKVGPARKFDQEMPVDLHGKEILFGNFLEQAAKGKSDFWQYSTTNNCQRFVSDLLSSSGLLTSELKNFIMQDADELLKDSPLTKKISDTVTDFGNRLDVVLTGAGRFKLPDPIPQKGVDF